MSAEAIVCTDVTQYPGEVGVVGQQQISGVGADPGGPDRNLLD
jgi:hypothetical protein